MHLSTAQREIAWRSTPAVWSSTASVPGACSRQLTEARTTPEPADNWPSEEARRECRASYFFTLGTLFSRGPQRRKGQQGWLTD